MPFDGWDIADLFTDLLWTRLRWTFLFVGIIACIVGITMLQNKNPGTAIATIAAGALIATASLVYIIKNRHD